jgi:DSF synthase
MSAAAHIASIAGFYKQLSTHHDAENRAIWCYMDARPRACFSPDLLEELIRLQRAISSANENGSTSPSGLPIRYVILASRSPGIFNLGGDLSLFVDFIRTRNREGLRQYAMNCVHVSYQNATSYDSAATTISLVQGDALGGGFEAALSSRVIIAQRGTRFGLPEVLFNLFPGMGAYSFLARRLDPARAERLILSGRTYIAEELWEMGIVDVLTEPGRGEEAVSEYIKQHGRRANAHEALGRVRQRYNPISYEELADITDIWVDAALNLRPRDLRMMERLVRSQDRRQGDMEEDILVDRLGG